MYKARKDGCLIKVRYGKVLLCGANGADKTNFLNLLMNNKFNPKHISTEVAKPHQATIVVKAQMIMHHEELTFKIMNIDDEIDHLMLYLPKNTLNLPLRKKLVHQYKMLSILVNKKVPQLKIKKALLLWKTL